MDLKILSAKDYSRVRANDETDRFSVSKTGQIRFTSQITKKFKLKENPFMFVSVDADSDESKKIYVYFSDKNTTGDAFQLFFHENASMVSMSALLNEIGVNFKKKKYTGEFTGSIRQNGNMWYILSFFESNKKSNR